MLMKFLLPFPTANPRAELRSSGLLTTGSIPLLLRFEGYVETIARYTVADAIPRSGHCQQRQRELKILIVFAHGE
jgi:hypothetical protein